ncbi:hypothetical protein KSP39_PZI011161 [Platanthera zijinensis]|uniref:RRM domain-containing protein n=1 Tax=Platanthera zijinensis TaxID=2320716 RepID=A0AAP0BGT3_9ASPA
MTHNKEHQLIINDINDINSVPENMREYYYFSLIISNLTLCTTTAALQRSFESLPGYIHANIDMDIQGKPLGTGEVIFADETSLHAATVTMENHIIDGQKISISELTLFDVK